MENQIISELFAQYGRGYKLGSTDKETTDCVQILRNSQFSKLVSNNLTDFSVRVQILFWMKLGRVADVIDRKDFSNISKYKPTKDKLYILL